MAAIEGWLVRKDRQMQNQAAINRGFKAGVLVFTGPGPAEPQRLERLVHGLQSYEPGIEAIVIVDDNSGMPHAEILADLFPRSRILSNPRNGKGNGWQGGLSTALAAGLRLFATMPDIDFIVRLDTDSLVIAPFVDKIGRAFAAQPETGLLGTFNHYPASDEQRLPHSIADYCRTIVSKISLPLAVWRHGDWPTRFQCVLRKKDRIPTRITRNALHNGYRYGDFIQGGGYALSGELVRRACKAGFLDIPEAFMWIPLGEDHLATLLCYACGLKAADLNSPGDPFAVLAKGIPDHPSALKQAGYSVLHSVKNDERWSEEEIFSLMFGPQSR
jgi:hypothetical protein